MELRACIQTHLQFTSSALRLFEVLTGVLTCIDSCIHTRQRTAGKELQQSPDTRDMHPHQTVKTKSISTLPYTDCYTTAHQHTERRQQGNECVVMSRVQQHRRPTAVHCFVHCTPGGVNCSGGGLDRAYSVFAGLWSREWEWECEEWECVWLWVYSGCVSGCDMDGQSSADVRSGLGVRHLC
jgi:hypothetical protein